MTGAAQGWFASRVGYPSQRLAVRAWRGPVRERLLAGRSLVPALRSSRVPGPPDFVGVGVQRAGTSWWFSLLQQHPAVASVGMAGKETHFFDDLWHGRLSERDIARYHQLFRRRPDQISGEWTPRYLADPWVVPLLRRAAPQARILVLLRDPLERFRSGLTHVRQLSGRVRAEDVTDAVMRGFYARQLVTLLTHVPAEQVMVLQLERCRIAPQQMLDRTFGFLGLEPGLVVASTRPVNAASRPPVDVSPELLEEVRVGYLADVRALSTLLPGDVDVDVGLWPCFPDA